MKTIEDLRNPARDHGFDHIQMLVAKHRLAAGRNPRYRAQVYGGSRTSAGHAWSGPPRETAEAAAQDYCDYINGLPTVIEVKQRPGRVDLFVRADGTVFSDLPGKPSRVKALLRSDPEARLQRRTQSSVAAHLLELDQADWYVEYKARGDQYSVNVALGQLLRRRYADDLATGLFGGAHLAAVLGTEPSTESRGLLEYYGIRVLVRS